MFGGRRMSHDLEDLLALIKVLEERIIALERSRAPDREYVTHDNDAYYWEHG